MKMESSFIIRYLNASSVHEVGTGLYPLICPIHLCMDLVFFTELSTHASCMHIDTVLIDLCLAQVRHIAFIIVWKPLSMYRNKGQG